ncbi:hypothetical protein [uncultured Psychroserpens sp.]|uniref:tetratricopeptide repeat protein n=1 Tax=uncultured Psychroserpens sp. TaxID=255436 RepID=UPI00261EA0AA|nr:hypothetical protein [uncultured Psychroserpens sp.]
MQRPLFIFFFITFGLLNLYAQNVIYELPEKQMTFINQGKDCVKEQKSNCNTFFENALKESIRVDNDSILAQTYFEICNVLDFVGNSEDHIAYAKRGLELDGKNHPLVTNRLLRELGYAYSRNGTIDSLIPTYEKAIYWAEYANDSSTIAMSRIRLASSYRRIGNIKKSIELLLDTRVFVEASNDIHRESGLSFTLANAYASNGDYDLAISNYREAANGFLEENDKGMYGAAIISLGMVSLDNGDHKLALEELPKGIQIFEAIDDQNGILTGKSHLGHAYYLDGDFDKAITTLKETIKKSQEIGNKILENMSRRYLAQVYIDKNDKDLALKETTIIYNEEKARGISDAYLVCVRLHAEALAINNKSSEAVEVYEEYITKKDSIFTKDKEKEIANMRELYEAEKRENQIELLEKNVSLSNLQKTLYGIGMFSFIAIAALLYFGFKQRIKKNKIEREKQEAIYKQEIEFKKKELTSQTLHLVQKNTFIQELKENLEKIKKSPELFKVEFRRLVMLLKKESAEDKDWEVFKSYFSEVHNNFDNKIKAISEDITEKEMRLASFLRMNLSTKEIASMLNVLPDSVLKSKYRLKKKLQLEKDQDLNGFLNTL